ncbi:MAG: hypothetical protein K2G69_08330 [Muribaculaceae bacterium]|nr:hypothetical protein [Muribaculaceae bacterium]
MRKLRETTHRSHEIIDIVADVARKTGEGLNIIFCCGGENTPASNPPINFIFGNAQYIKDRLEELSQSSTVEMPKFPLIALFCPFSEQRGEENYYGRASVTVLIACSTTRELNNEQRREYSFVNILHPVYNRFISELEKDGRLEVPKGGIRHSVSENYSFGKYGAYTPAGEEVGEPIDAIMITHLELKVRKQSCI